MELRPVTQETVAEYPTRKAQLARIMGRWVRKVGVAVALASSAAFWIGCPVDGAMIEPDYYYTCDDNNPEPAEDFAYPGTFSRYLCPGQSTFAELTVEDQITLQLELVDQSYSSYSDLQAIVTDAQGAVAGALDSSQPSLELDLAPGIWRITVTQRSETTEGNFSLNIDEVEQQGSGD